MCDQFSDLGRKTIAFVAHDYNAGTFVRYSIGSIEIFAGEESTIEKEPSPCPSLKGREIISCRLL